MTHRVVMRNLEFILEKPELDKMMRNFFVDDKDNQNPVNFAMILPQKNLPSYQYGSTFVDYYLKILIEPDSEDMTESFSIFGGVSENYAKTRYYDREMAERSKEKANQLANKDDQDAFVAYFFGRSELRRVEHRIVDLKSDIIHNKIQKVLERITKEEEGWSHHKLAVLYKTLMDKFSRDIDGLRAVKSLMKIQFRWSIFIFGFLFFMFILTFFYPLVRFLLSKGA